VNLASPNPLLSGVYEDFAKAWEIPIGLPVAHVELELGAVLLRTETELILKSRR